MVLIARRLLPRGLLGLLAAGWLAAAAWQQQRLATARDRPVPPVTFRSAVPAPAEPDLAALRERMKEYHRLEHERDKLRAALSPRPSPPPSPQPETDGPWRNAGCTTPADTVHTVIWAAVHGELGHLRAALRLDGEARAAAEALFAELSPTEQAEYGDPATVVAVLLAGRMPLDLQPPEVVAVTYPAPTRAELRLKARRTGGAPAEKVYQLFHDGNGWRLEVPLAVVQRYHRMLTRS